MSYYLGKQIGKICWRGWRRARGDFVFYLEAREKGQHGRLRDRHSHWAFVTQATAVVINNVTYVIWKNMQPRTCISCYD